MTKEPTIKEIAQQCAAEAHARCQLGFVANGLLEEFARDVLKKINYESLLQAKADSIMGVAKTLDHGDVYGDDESGAVVILDSYYQQLLRAYQVARG